MTVINQEKIFTIYIIAALIPLIYKEFLKIQSGQIGLDLSLLR